MFFYLSLQKGFGWTNGVILDLLHKYGSKISVSGEVPMNTYSMPLTYSLAALTSFFALAATLMYRI
jgi:hypothetical protein